MRRSALVLAGGRSSRMGVNKATLPFGDESFIQCTVRACREVCADVVVAVGPEGSPEDLRSLPMDVRVLRDPGVGPLGAIATGLSDAGPDALLFVTACDTPLLDQRLIQFLFAQAEGNRGAVPMLAGRPQATCAVYASGLSADAEAFVQEGDLRASRLAGLPGVLQLSEDDLRKADPELWSFRGCNTVEEYVALLESAGQPIPYGFLRAAGLHLLRHS